MTILGMIGGPSMRPYESPSHNNLKQITANLIGGTEKAEKQAGTELSARNTTDLETGGGPGTSLNPSNTTVAPSATTTTKQQDKEPRK